MSRSVSKNKNQDYRLAFQCALSFFNFAKPYLDKLAASAKKGAAEAARDPGGLVGSATNLILALELYLKSLRAGLGMNVPETHNLWSLYKSLPNNVKGIIEYKYKEKLANTPQENLLEITVAYELATPEGPKTPEFPKNPDESKDIKPLLKRYTNAFNLWRYVYESVKPGERYFFIRLEYCHLKLLCDSLKEYIQENDPKNKKP